MQYPQVGTNAKRNMPRVIGVELQFHITNYYKKELITNYGQMCKDSSIKLKTAFMTFSSDTLQDVMV